MLHGSILQGVIADTPVEVAAKEMGVGIAALDRAIQGKEGVCLESWDRIILWIRGRIAILRQTTRGVRAAQLKKLSDMHTAGYDYGYSRTLREITEYERTIKQIHINRKTAEYLGLPRADMDKYLDMVIHIPPGFGAPTSKETPVLLANKTLEGIANAALEDPELARDIIRDGGEDPDEVVWRGQKFVDRLFLSMKEM